MNVDLHHPPAGRLLTLPKWAGEYIGRLRRKIKELEDSIDAGNASLGEGVPRVVFDAYSDNPRVVDPATRIRLELGGGWHNDVVVQMRDDHVEVRAESGIRIRPWAANVIRVYPDER